MIERMRVYGRAGHPPCNAITAWCSSAGNRLRALEKMAEQQRNAKFRDQAEAYHARRRAGKELGYPLQVRNSDSTTLSRSRRQQTPVVCRMTRNKSSSEKGLLIMG